ncbi:hypothetical protein ACJ73_02312 [Blastomyces percursus]|uniref:Uncharacterized protein n=1 Tax=Blastomyces percursus TaxID=1658174 RepID=A0A1J9QBT5_9EURO|nr:hypothetical protein ACJ73_02312 [Blastomyces percursus]
MSSTSIMASNSDGHQILSNNKIEPLLALRIKVHCEECAKGSPQCNPFVHIYSDDLQHLKPLFKGVFPLGKDQVELAVEPSGISKISEELTDLNFLRFTDMDPLLFPEGDDFSPVTIYEKMCHIRHYYNKMTVYAMNEGNSRLVIWHRDQCQLIKCSGMELLATQYWDQCFRLHAIEVQKKVLEWRV